MFGTIGGPELFLILIIALIVFGPTKLPEIGRSLGRMMVEFKKATSDFQQTVEREIEADKLRSYMQAPATILEEPAKPVLPPSPETTSAPAEAPPAVPSAPGEPTVSRTDVVPPAETK
jgi:sec-independent protein translocase protein TatA